MVAATKLAACRTRNNAACCTDQRMAATALLAAAHSHSPVHPESRRSGCPLMRQGLRQSVQQIPAGSTRQTQMCSSSQQLLHGMCLQGVQCLCLVWSICQSRPAVALHACRTRSFTTNWYCTTREQLRPSDDSACCAHLPRALRGVDGLLLHGGKRTAATHHSCSRPCAARGASTTARRCSLRCRWLACNKQTRARDFSTHGLTSVCKCSGNGCGITEGRLVFDTLPSW
jgi:hypothetical protein